MSKMELIGREKEVQELERLYRTDKSEFVAVYGRRRVGKTYLINQVFSDRIVFRHTGITPVDINSRIEKSPMKVQLKAFFRSLNEQGGDFRKIPHDWYEAFLMLKELLEKKKNGKKRVVFLDELSFMDTRKSEFIPALSDFYNNYVSRQSDILLIVCGSATSYILNNLVNNHAGLYDRLTYQMKISPFKLKDTELLLLHNGWKLPRLEITKAYMIFGGIPFYLDYLNPDYSLARNIDNLIFRKEGSLRNEFSRLFSSTFTNAELTEKIVRSLFKKRIGLTKDELLKSLGKSDSPAFRNAVLALEESDFVLKYIPFGGKKKDERIKLIDPFCLFYLRFVDRNSAFNESFYSDNQFSQPVLSAQGYGFEDVCFNHIPEIKKALGISGVQCEVGPYFQKDTDNNKAYQIDMVIVRKDNVVDLCEAKFSLSEFELNLKGNQRLAEKISHLNELLPKRYIVQAVLLTTFGLKNSQYSSTFQSVITLDDLFN